MGLRATRRWPRWLAVLAVLAMVMAVAVVVAACGGDDDEESADTADEEDGGDGGGKHDGPFVDDGEDDERDGCHDDHSDAVGDGGTQRSRVTPTLFDISCVAHVRRVPGTGATKLPGAVDVPGQASRLVPTRDDGARVGRGTAHPRPAGREIAVDHERVPRDDAVDTRLGGGSGSCPGSQRRCPNEKRGRGRTAEQQVQYSLSDDCHLVTANNVEEPADSTVDLDHRVNGGIALRYGSRGRPNSRSAMMLSCTSVVPP